MRLAIVITLAAVSLFADDKLQQYRNDLTASVAKADATLAEAKKERDTKVRRAFKSYLKVLKKAQVYWVKQGDLDKALEVREEIRKVKSIVEPKSRVRFSLPPIKAGTTTDSQTGRMQPPPGSYRGIVFQHKYAFANAMMNAEPYHFKGWSSLERDAWKIHFAQWKVWHARKKKR